MLAGKSGSFSLSSSGFTVTVGWSETYEIETNKSIVSIDYLKLRSGNWYGWTYYIDGKIRVNGVDVIVMNSYAGTHNGHIGSQNTDVNIHPSGGSVTTGSTEVVHDSDGSKSITIEVIGNRFNNLSGFTTDERGGNGWGVRGSKTISLTTIPRATTPTLSSTTADMGSIITANLSSRASASFTHTIEIRPDTSNVWTAVATKATGTNINITVPDFASSIPNAESATLHIRCTTYSGNTSVGEKTIQMTAVVPSTAAYYPTATISAEEASLSGYSVYIQGHSRLLVSISANGAAGSTVKSISSTFDGGTYSGASWRSAPIAGYGTLEIRTKITDSRGRSTTVVHNVSVQAYAKPTISLFSAERCTEHQEVSDNGNYAHIRYGYYISCAEHGVTATMAISYKLRSASSYSTLLNGTASSETDRELYPNVAMDSNYTYDIRISVRDSLGETTEKIIPLQSAKVVFDVLANGLGFAFGKTAEDNNVLEVSWDLKAQGITAASLSVNGFSVSQASIIALMLNAVYPVGSIYTSVNNVSPQTFLGGTWEAITGRFLLSADQSHSAGSTGGTESHKHTTGSHALTVEEMPSHNHLESNRVNWSDGEGDNGLSGFYWGSSNLRVDRVEAATSSAGSGVAHSHGDTGTANHLPPYLAVYMWKRTA